MEIIIIILLVVVIAKLQTIKIHGEEKLRISHAVYAKLHAMQRDPTMAMVALNLRNLIEWLPQQFDTGAAFERLKDNTNDEVLRAAAMAAVMFAKNPPKEIKIKRK